MLKWFAGDVKEPTRLSQLSTYINQQQRPYATGELEDSGQENDEKMLCKTVHSQSFLSFCCPESSSPHVVLGPKYNEVHKTILLNLFI